MIVKVCGMNDPENIRDVAALGVDLLGYIFYAKSPRCFHPSTGRAEHSLRGGGMGSVCVSVNATEGELLEMLRYRPAFLQLHGVESPDLCREFRRRGVGIIKAIPVGKVADLDHTTPYEGTVDYFLFDTRCDTYGGSGRAFDWTVLEAYTGQTPFLLSGGLRPESGEAITRFRHPRFAGIDLNSGFETSPGYKDVTRIQKFLNALSSA
ncbi:MAG: phosphoribosylanthranilate isomerase [Tannerellaceae bacterium]|jgi:phosphoribosylanthranilate isomerase|nr:phosphoribosylanthranilate isomerase [Tannerellaceae bacterium]